jgi:hypothetical protein
MRYLFGFLCVCALVWTSPESASAQAGEEGTSAEPSAEEPVQSPQPTRSRLERWHPEAFVDPTTPTPEPALQLGVDSTGLEVTPTAPLTVEALKRQEKKLRKRRVIIGVTVSILVAGVIVGVSAAAVSRSISRGLE